MCQANQFDDWKRTSTLCLVRLYCLCHLISWNLLWWSCLTNVSPTIYTYIIHHSVCGDLVDTESSFSGAIASWKKVMTGWERNLVFEQVKNCFHVSRLCSDHVYNSTHSHPTFVSSYLSKSVTSSVCGPAWTKTLLWYVFVVIMTSETNQQENLLIIGLPNSVTTF